MSVDVYVFSLVPKKNTSFTSEGKAKCWFPAKIFVHKILDGICWECLDIETVDVYIYKTKLDEKEVWIFCDCSTMYPDTFHIDFTQTSILNSSSVLEVEAMVLSSVRVPLHMASAFTVCHHRL